MAVGTRSIPALAAPKAWISTFARPVRLYPACPMALLEFGHRRLGLGHPSPQAAFSVRGAQKGAHAVGQATIVGPGDGASLRRPAARLLEGTGTASFRHGPLDDGPGDVRHARGALPRQWALLGAGKAISARSVDELLARDGAPLIRGAMRRDAGADAGGFQHLVELAGPVLGVGGDFGDRPPSRSFVLLAHAIEQGLVGDIAGCFAHAGYARPC